MVIPFPTKTPSAPKPLAIFLMPDEWLEIGLRLAGRTHNAEVTLMAEAKMLQQLIASKGAS